MNDEAPRRTPAPPTRGNLSYPQALDAVLAGAHVTRTGWNGKGMWIALQRPDAHSKMTLPYIYMRTAQADFVPWLCSQTDALADDWMVVAGPVPEAA